MNINDWINFSAKIISKNFDNNHEIGKRKSLLFLNKIYNTKNKLIFENKELTSFELDLLNKCLNEYINLEKPIEYIIGNIEFDNIELYIEEPILIPRQETEYWLNKVKNNLIQENKKNNYFKIADLGCGSGCIGISFLKSFKNSECTAIDIDEKAIKLSLKNANYNNVKDRYNCYLQNMDDFFNVNYNKNKFDIIFSNPPYININNYLTLDNSVKNWESKISLTDNSDGMCFIKKIIENGYNFLNENGFIYIEIDPKNAQKTTNYCYFIKKYSSSEIIIDQYQKERIILIHK